MPRTNFRTKPYLEILLALTAGPKLTPDLAAEIGVTPTGTYHRCRRLEDEKGWLRSDLTSHPQPYCIDCQVILTAENYEEHEEEDHEIRQASTQVRRWKLTAAGRKVADSVSSQPAMPTAPA